MKTLRIKNMVCPRCIMVIEKTMEQIPFIAEPTLDDYSASDGEARNFAADLIRL